MVASFDGDGTVSLPADYAAVSEFALQRRWLRLQLLWGTTAAMRQLAELILEGTGDVSGIGRLVERITTAHTERMRTLGLNP